jgi:hypothetical protein
MRRSRGFVHPVARRVALASMTVLATSGIGMIAGPAVGQIVIPIGGPILGGSSQGATVTNAGSASANTGGNTAVGNNSTNSASTTSTGGDLLNVPVSLGAPTNTSEGSAAVTTGPATAAGNSSDTSVGQSNASGNTVNSFLATQSQGAGVTNAGSASANTGGNTAIGNNSQNNATSTQQVSGGLLGVGVTLGGPTNNSTGTATINAGAANAVGNSASTNVGQSAQGGAGGFFGGPGGGGLLGGGSAVLGAGGPCGNRFASFQDVNVSNRGEATASTGNNEAIGNASTNDASVSSTGQTVSGGLLGVGVTIGGPVNNSSGTAVINTGPATAVGNDSTTSVGQSQTCPQPMVAAQGGRHPVIVPKGHVAAKHHAVHHPRTLARTGLDSADLGMIGGALLGAGMLLVASQRRRLAARHAAVPMAGFGMGLGADEWDRPVR